MVALKDIKIKRNRRGLVKLWTAKRLAKRLWKPYSTAEYKIPRRYLTRRSKETILRRVGTTPPDEFIRWQVEVEGIINDSDPRVRAFALRELGKMELVFGLDFGDQIEYFIKGKIPQTDPFGKDPFIQAASSINPVVVGVGKPTTLLRVLKACDHIPPKYFAGLYDGMFVGRSIVLGSMYMLPGKIGSEKAEDIRAMTHLTHRSMILCVGAGDDIGYKESQSRFLAATSDPRSDAALVEILDGYITNTIHSMSDEVSLDLAAVLDAIVEHKKRHLESKLQELIDSLNNNPGTSIQLAVIMAKANLKVR